MGYKEQKWFELKRNGIKFEITVRDQDWTKLETTQFTPQNFNKTMKDIGNRYGIDDNMLTPNKEIQDEIEQMRKNDLF